MFVAQGYHSAAMDDIAERAGVSKPVLYQHFPGKLELYLALLEESCDTHHRGLKDALASTDDNKQRVPATMHVFYDYVANAPGRLPAGLRVRPDQRARRPRPRSTGSRASAPRRSPR